VDESSNGHTIIISGSAALADHVVATIAPNAHLIAADGALDHALAAGLEPAMLVGDLDSVGPAALAWAEEHAEIRRHPIDKNKTDTELAISAAIETSPGRITLIGGGDRLDHSLAALGALGSPALADVDGLDGWWDGQHIEVLHGRARRALHVQAGSTVSLLALHGRCDGVTIDGAQWPLAGMPLDPLIGRGVSNIALDTTVTVSVEAGVLTVFDHPESLAQPGREHLR
jgi:thiamine pyrophosphokinase